MLKTELIKQLEALPDDAEIGLYDVYGDYTWTGSLELCHVGDRSDAGHDNVWAFKTIYA